MELEARLADELEELPYLTPVTEGDVLASNYGTLIDPDAARAAVLGVLNQKDIYLNDLGVVGIKRLTKVGRNLINAGDEFSEMQLIKLYALNLIGAKMIEHGGHDLKKDNGLLKMHSHFYSHAATCAEDLAEIGDPIFWLKRAQWWHVSSAGLSWTPDITHAAVAYGFASFISYRLYGLTKENYYLKKQLDYIVRAAIGFSRFDKKKGSKLFRRAASVIDSLLPDWPADLKDLSAADYRHSKVLLEEKVQLLNRAGKTIANDNDMSSAHCFALAGDMQRKLYELSLAFNKSVKGRLQEFYRLRNLSAELFQKAENYALAGRTYKQSAWAARELFETYEATDKKLEWLRKLCNAAKSSVKAYELVNDFETSARQKLFFGSAVVVASELASDFKAIPTALNLVPEAYSWFVGSAKKLVRLGRETCFEYYNRAIESAAIMNLLCDEKDNKVWRSNTLVACDGLLRTYKFLPRQSEQDELTRKRTIEIKMRFENEKTAKIQASAGLEDEILIVERAAEVVEEIAIAEEAEAVEKEIEVLTFECPECGAEVSEDAVECLSCDVAFEADAYDEYAEI